MTASCTLCHITRDTVGMIERHIDDNHHVSGHVSDYWERIEEEDEPSEDQSGLARFA